MQNNKELPYFSVIIPQKNRAEYLVHTLKTCVIQDYPNFEVIVSDDCSDDDSVKVANDLSQKDPRIKVYAHKQHLGMRDNFEFALNQVKPGYVLALGGDDGLTPGCIWRMYDIIKRTGTKLLTWTPAVFTYPISGEDSRFAVRIKHSKEKTIQSKDFLRKLTETFDYKVNECPMFYVKGVASTELVNRVKSRTKDNSFYYCPTPDGFSGVVLAGEVKQYILSYEPLSIIGSTTKSQGLNYTRTDKESRRESEQFFKDSIRRSMHPELASQPYSPLITLMTADYLLTAKDLPGWPGDVPKISFEHLIRKTFEFISNTSYENETLVRELRILKEIAIQHNLLDLFTELNSKTKRKIGKNKGISGFAVTNFVRFSCKEINIDNIFDASMATNFIYNFIGKFRFRHLITLFVNSCKIVLARYGFFKKVALPQV